MVRRATRTAGERVERFKIVRHVASGGMGEVYESVDETTGETVALKLLADSSTDAAVRFAREAQLAIRIEHPRIVRTRRQGQDADGTVFIAMDLLRGEDLGARLARGPLDPSEAIAVGVQVCEALAYAHAQRVVHRDLKPENVFLCAGPGIDVRVLDFGIARGLDDETMTASGAVVGTFGYVSPEQARGDRTLDPRSDLWSLGAVLYRSLAGCAPFAAATLPAMLFQILCGSPRLLAAARPGLPPGLVDSVHRALARARVDRFSSADAMRSALLAVDLDATPAAAATVAREARSTAESMIDVDAPLAEMRLASVVFLRSVREPLRVHELADTLDGEVVALAGDDLLVVFGSDGWRGDEPARAARLAHDVARAAEFVGVATGRALQGADEPISGEVVDRAVTLASRPGVTLDDATQRAVRAATPAAERSDPSELAQRTPFVGRQLETAMLVEHALAAATQSQPRGVLVLATTGMGKSRLAHHAATALCAREPAATLLYVRCDAFARDAPFAVLRRALAPVAAPGLAAHLGGESGFEAGDPVAALDRARAAFETVLVGLAERGSPVVLILDDAQWLDPSSRAAVRWVCENNAELPLAVWALARPEAREVLASLVPGASVRDLEPLARDEASALLHAVAGRVSNDVLDRAGGHPLFVEELGLLSRDGSERSALPTSIEGVHLAQLDRMDLTEREFVKRASVFGATAWVEGVVALGGDAQAFAVLRRTGVLAARAQSRFEATRELAFRSALMHETAYGLFTEMQRARFHGRAAQWLVDRGRATPDEVARHWDLAGESHFASEAYTHAAEFASRVSDAASTIAHAARALALTSDPGLRWRALAARDTALQLDGDRALQRDGLHELGVLAEAFGDDARAEAAWRWCYHARITGDRHAAVDAGTRAIALTSAPTAWRWASLAHGELALLYADAGEFGPARDHAERARAVADRNDDRWLQARAFANLAYVAFEQESDVAATLAMFDSAAEGYGVAGDRRRQAIALTNGGCALLRIGRVDAAMTRFEGADALARRVGNARTVAVAAENRGTILRMRGELQRARTELDFAASEARRLGHHRLAAATAVELVYLALTAGSGAEELCALADECERLAALAGTLVYTASACAAAARSRSKAGVDARVTVAAARAHAASLASGMTQASAELLVAVYVAGGRASEDRDAARAAVVQFAASAGSADDRAASLAAFAQRYVVPPEVLA